MADTPLVPIELFLADENPSAEQVERACSFASGAAEHDMVAVAVDISHSKRAADLLFGTGVGAVSLLDPRRPLRDQARRSVAAGASEVGVPLLGLNAIADLKVYLGSQTPLTIDVTTPDGFDLDTARRALMIGADFVAFRPDFSTEAGLVDSARLLALANELQLGGIKLASPSLDDHQLHGLIDDHEWSRSPGRSRLCLSAASVVP